MADHRLIRTKIWSDSWFYQLSREAQLLYLYLLTNKNTHICGYYELPPHEIMTHLKYNKIEMVEKYMLELVPNVRYVKNWVAIKNYPKHQNVTNNLKVQVAIDRALADVPAEVLSSLKSEVISHKSEAMDSLSIGYQETAQNIDGGDKGVDKGGEKAEDKVKKKYGEFKNVLLTDDEKEKLKNLYGKNEALKLVEELSTYIKSKGVKYKDHYATVRGWARKKGLAVQVDDKIPKMIPETLPNGSVRLIPNPDYHE